MHKVAKIIQSETETEIYFIYLFISLAIDYFIYKHWQLFWQLFHVSGFTRLICDHDYIKTNVKPYNCGVTAECVLNSFKATLICAERLHNASETGR